MQTLIYNATLVLPETITERGWLLIEDDLISALGESASCPQPQTITRSINAEGNFVLPGMIDLHCDGIEKLVMPRPNVMFDINVALDENDRRLAACGITTEFHALSLDDSEFGVRSTDFVGELAQAIKNTSDLLVRHEIHARFEVTSVRGFEVVTEMLKNGEVRLVSLMDHSPGQGQYKTEQSFRDYLKKTVHSTDEEIDQMLILKREQIENIPSRIETVAQLARENGIAIATHDDDSAAKVENWPALGVTISEFPTTIEAATRAHELGLAVCMGAPNVLRGRSSGGNLSALEAIQAGITNVLCSDYYPAAFLATVFKLAAQKVLPLPEATRLVTLNPALALGLGAKFGSLEVGKVADVIIVQLKQHLPRVKQLFLAGEEHLRLI
jgi:alpha-D-ribose 1-methylphosphonate 5-triphosphate diphosphatase